MKFCFILNPVSGKTPADAQAIKHSVLTHFPQAIFHQTKAPKHATQLARQAAQAGIDAVIAMGGDGTINEVAQGLVNTQSALGIIPRGSGNGFARELGMLGPLYQTLAKLKKAAVQPCDVGYANGELFLNVAGVGIEAAIAWQFMEHGKAGKRGMLPYFTLGAKTFWNYQPNTLQISLPGTVYTAAPLTLVFANNRQYGSNFVIAPQAGIADGKLDMVTVQNTAKYKLAVAVPFFLLGKIPPFGVTSYAKIHNAIVESEQEILYHIDGEPRKAAHRLEITIAPRALRLLVP